jgi:hypothetical protein
VTPFNIVLAHEETRLKHIPIRSLVVENFAWRYNYSCPATLSHNLTIILKEV